MDELLVMKALRELTDEVRHLRLQVLRLSEKTKEEHLKGRWLTMKEACDYLKISRNTMQRRLAEGEITFGVKNGKSWKFPADKLERYVSAC